MDNYITHKTKRAKTWLVRHPRFRVHFTPTYSSWINQVERFFALLTERCIKRGVHRSTQALERDIRNFVKATNDEPKPFIWTKSADHILENVRRFCDRVLEVHGQQHDYELLIQDTSPDLERARGGRLPRATRQLRFR